MSKKVTRRAAVRWEPGDGCVAGLVHIRKTERPALRSPVPGAVWDERAEPRTSDLRAASRVVDEDSLELGAGRRLHRSVESRVQFSGA